MPQIQSEADQEWYGQEDVDAGGQISRSTSLADSDGGPPPVQGLPGFAKASDLQKKRSIVEIMDDDDDEPQATLEDQLFPDEGQADGVDASTKPFFEATDDQAVEEQVWVPRKRLNRDLSRHNSAGTSHISVLTNEDIAAPQVLDSTPRVTIDTGRNEPIDDDFWAQPAPVSARSDASKKVVAASALPVSPPRGPNPKSAVSLSGLPQSGSSRCKPKLP